MDEELNGERPDHEPVPPDAAAPVGLAKRSVQVT